MASEDEELLKVVLTGPAGAGKTQLLGRATGQPFSADVLGAPPTGSEVAAFGVLPVRVVDGRRIRLQVWDLCFRTASSPYDTLPRNCAVAAVALLFDATSMESYDLVRAYYMDIVARWPLAPLALVACKCDGTRVVDRALLLETASILRTGRNKKAPLWCAETSAATRDGVDRFFEDLTRSAAGISTGLGIAEDAQQAQKKSRGCCTLL